MTIMNASEGIDNKFLSEHQEIKSNNYIRTIPKLQSGKVIIALNIRTFNIIEIKFTRINKYSFKVLFADKNDTREGKILTSNSKVNIMLFGSLYYFYFVNEDLCIIAPEEIKLYE